MPTGFLLEGFIKSFEMRWKSLSRKNVSLFTSFSPNMIFGANARLTPLLLAWTSLAQHLYQMFLTGHLGFLRQGGFARRIPVEQLAQLVMETVFVLKPQNPKVTSPNKSCHAKSRYLKRDPHIQNLHGIGTAVLNSFLEINLLVYKVVVANICKQFARPKVIPKTFPNTTSNPECSKNN